MIRPAAGLTFAAYRRIVTWVTLLTLVVGCGTRPRSAQRVTIPLSIRGHTLTVEVAADPVSRDQGLMFRRRLAGDGGMLFAFPHKEQMSFWMKNTHLPLSIAFLDTDGTILGITDMQPYDESSHLSPTLARYALEVRQGWFASRRIVPGDRCVFRFPPGLKVN